jgi:hypothetical protein
MSGECEKCSEHCLYCKCNHPEEKEHWVDKLSAKDMIDELEKGLGEGPLTLQIICCVCGTQYEINRESIAMAFIMKTTFLDYFRYVQSSECRICKEKKN